MTYLCHPSFFGDLTLCVTVVGIVSPWIAVVGAVDDVMTVCCPLAVVVRALRPPRIDAIVPLLHCHCCGETPAATTIADMVAARSMPPLHGSAVTNRHQEGGWICWKARKCMVVCSVVRCVVFGVFIWPESHCRHEPLSATTRVDVCVCV